MVRNCLAHLRHLDVVTGIGLLMGRRESDFFKVLASEDVLDSAYVLLITLTSGKDNDHDAYPIIEEVYSVTRAVVERLTIHTELHDQSTGVAIYRRACLTLSMSTIMHLG